MTIKKKLAFLLAALVTTMALVGAAAALFPDAASEHPVSFLLLGALIIVSAVAMMLLHLYHEDQKKLEQAQHGLERNALQEELDFAMRGIGGGVLIARDDEDKSFVYVSESLAALFGYTVDELLAVSGNTSSGIVFAEDFHLFKEDMADDANTLRFRVRCKDGSLKWVSSRGKIIVNEKGERLRYSFNHDITQLMEINRKADELTALLRQERSLYRDALLHDCDYAYIVNVDEDRFHDVYKGDFLNRYLFDASMPSDEVMSRVVESMKPVILHNQEEIHLTAHYKEAYEQGKRVIEVDYYVPGADVYKRKTLFLSKSEDGILYAFIVAHDITDRMKEDAKVQVALTQLAEKAKQVGTGNLDIEVDVDAPGPVGILADVLRQTVLNLKWHMDKLKTQAQQDPLTGVKNKRRWQEAEERLDREIQAGTAEFAIVVCDINGLKQVNDTLGHEAGDSLIVRSCRYICKIFKHSPVYRIGGDEFTVILEGSDLADFDKLLDEFHAGMAMQQADDPMQPPFSVALGMSCYACGDTSFSEVFQRADQAMYLKKAEMKNVT